MRTNEEIVDLIIALKNEKGLSLSELARRVGYAKSGLSRYFNKTREFPLNKVDIFAKVLGVAPGYLLGFDSQKEKNVTSAYIPDVYWKSIVELLDEQSIERLLESILEGTSEKGNFAAYGGKHPAEMSEMDFENHILFTYALKECLRFAKKINLS